MTESLNQTIETSLSNLASKVSSRLPNNHQQILLLSDLDETLSNDYRFDKKTNNHIPSFNRDLILATTNNPIIVATARLSNDPVIPMTHKQLGIPFFFPVIAEDGGAIVFQKDNKLVTSSVPAILNSKDSNLIPNTISRLHQQLEDNPLQIDGQNIFISRGLTILKVRAQNDLGKGSSNTHRVLADMLADQVSNDLFDIQTTGSSVTIKPKGISKAKGLEAVFKLFGNDIPSKQLFIVSTGDNKNDQSIFSRANLSICVGNKPLNANIFCPHGSDASLKVIQTIFS